MLAEEVKAWELSISDFSSKLSRMKRKQECLHAEYIPMSSL
jgi:hypothetical protein